VLLLGALLLPAQAVAQPDYEVDERPVIIIHGIGQSEVFLCDENGVPVVDADGGKTQGWPPEIEVAPVLQSVLLPLLGSLFLQRDMGLTDALKKTVNEIFDLFKMDENGMPLKNMQVHRFEGSVAECTQEEKDFIYASMPVQELAELVGEEKLYYFAYDSFGNNAAITQELYEKIQEVKEKHDVDSVNLIPVSLGGTLMNSLLEDYPEVAEDLHSIVYVIAALDGSRIVGDMYTRNLSTDNESLYLKMFPALTPGYMGDLLNIAIRLLPKSLVKGILDALIDSLVGDVISYSTTMWSLVPSGDYEKARALWLMDGKHDKIRAQTDQYWEAQKNSRANILALREAGVQVYAIAEYDVPLYSIAGSYDEVNADGIIHLDSASLGATSGYVGTKLPEGYVQKVDDGHDHISPDGIVDASTGALPEQTFYFKGQKHESTAKSDVVMRLAVRLATSSEYETVYSMEGWPQFNNGRETRVLRTEWIPQAKKIDQSALSEEDAAELQAAIEAAEAVLAKTVVVPGELEAAQGRLEAILIKLGVREAAGEDLTAKVLDPLFAFISDVLYYGFGARGFFDCYSAIWKK
jgi:pimeloyl-ACP methyl ester carboxylesterase